MTEGNKFALLIGVSECASGFKPLHCPPNGVIALREILTNPAIGGFNPEHVMALTNPTVSEMQRVIGEVFHKCSPQDLLLLYFTGHGVTDEHGDFFFTTRETEKFDNGSLNPGTAVEASVVRRQMSRCHSRRQVAILDCCFSGAFPDGVLAMDDQTVNVEQQLGGEGRAVLTAATSTQYALEQEGEELSVYTRYLVEGLKTGAAALNDQELIRAGHLHNYVRDKLKTAAAAMSPQIYAAREGREIVLAKALIDNELRFRKLVQKNLRADGNISPTANRILKRQRDMWNISEERATAIIGEVVQPFRERHESLEEFEEAYQEVIEFEYPFSYDTERELKDYQRILKLRDEDIAPIIERNTPAQSPTRTVQSSRGNASLQQPAAKSTSPSSDWPSEDIPLESEKGVDYQELRDLLKAGEWKEADQKTADLMLKAIGKDAWYEVSSDDLLNFPCSDLKTIDRLWVHYSRGRFGFSVQKEIYLECGGIPDGKYYKEAFEKFGDRVGWRVNNRWIAPPDVTLGTSAPSGHLPFMCLGVCGWARLRWPSFLFSRIQTCKV
ncbi:MAG: caspase, EACC1-associated type [Elainellaceae cyanobacterium]